MTKRHFIAAAAQVCAIRDGHWTNEPPNWTPQPHDARFAVSSFERAVWTAEAYILLFREFNPRFDQHTFLVACGLTEPTTKRKRS